MHNQVLICSRARFLQEKNNFYFQINDGIYFNEISGLFKKTIILAGEVTVEQVVNETLLLNKEVTCFDTQKVITRSFFGLLSLIWRSDIIYVFYPLKSSLLVAFLSKILRKKIIAYNGGAWSEIKSMGRKQSFHQRCRVKFYDYLEYLSVTLCTVYIVNNNLLFEKYLRNKKIIKTVPLIRITKKDIFIKQSNIDIRDIKLLAVNHIKPGKKIVEIIEAFNLLQGQNHKYNFSLKIIGKYDINDSYSRIVDEYIRNNNLQQKIDFTGIINDKDKLIEYYRSSDILLLVSDSEGFPRVIWEAFSQSLPVICSSLPNIILEFGDKKSPVFLLENNSPTNIKAAIEKLVNDDKLREKLIEEGLKRFKLKTSETPMNQLKKIIDLIDNA